MRIAAGAAFYAALYAGVVVGARPVEAQEGASNAQITSAAAAATENYVAKCKVQEALDSGKPKALKKASRCLTTAAANLNSLAVSEARITRLSEMLGRQQAKLVKAGAQPPETSQPTPPPPPPPPPPPAAAAPPTSGSQGYVEVPAPAGAEAPAPPSGGISAPRNQQDQHGKQSDDKGKTVTAVVEGLQDARSSPSACPDPSVLAEPENAAARAQGMSHLRVTRSVMEEAEVKDDFGYRIGSRYSTFQVTVANLDADHLYMIHDISLDYSDAMGAKPGTFEYRASTRDLSLMRGVPEQGADLDPRNFTLHVLQGLGAVAGAVTGLTPFAGVMGSSVAAFNGPFVQGFMGVLPDHSATQLNRLSDSAFQTNMVVDKGRSRSIAVFVPMRIMKNIDLEDVNVCVDGVFVTEVAVATGPTLTSAVFAKPGDGSALAGGKSTTVTVVGTGLVDKDTQVLMNGVIVGSVTTTDGKKGTLSIKALPSTYTTGVTVALEATGSSAPSASVVSTEK